MNLWRKSNELGWNVTVVDTHPPSRLIQGSLGNPGTTDTDAEKQVEKYRELNDNGYDLQPVEQETNIGNFGKIKND